MHLGASLAPALLPFLEELELRLQPLVLLRKANPSGDFPRCFCHLLQQRREFFPHTSEEGSNQRVHTVSAFHVSPQPQILLFMPSYSPPCTRPHSGRPAPFYQQPRLWWHVHPEAEQGTLCSWAVFALRSYLLGVLLQVEGWKMDEYPSGGYNKTRKQQLCDGEYSLSPSCSHSVSIITLTALPLTSRQISRDENCSVQKARAA